MRPTSVSSRTVSMSSRYFSTEPSVCSTTSASISSRPSAASACAQSIVSATPGGFARSSARRPAHERRRLLREPLRDPGHAQPHDLDLALDRRMPDPVEERAPLERVVQLARAVRGEDHGRLPPRADGAELGDRDLEVREHLEQERLELLVRAVDLVDEEHDGLVRVDRLEERSADEELGPEELLLGHRALLRGADVEELTRVVPLVDGVRDVEALVALEADQPGCRAPSRAPSPPRSSPRPPRLRAARASRARARGRAPSRARDPAGSRPREARPRARRSCESSRAQRTQCLLRPGPTGLDSTH